jgi:hypothetical protein
MIDQGVLLMDEQNHSERMTVLLMDEQNHSERMTKQWKENVVCVYEEGRGGGILT